MELLRIKLLLGFKIIMGYKICDILRRVMKPWAMLAYNGETVVCLSD